MEGIRGKKVLVVTPRTPFSMQGADELDRGMGIKLLQKLGCRVRVIVMVVPSDRSAVEEAQRTWGIPIRPVTYSFARERSTQERLGRFLRRLIDPRLWDGAAFEYSDPLTRRVLAEELNTFQPDVVWFDYTYLWPLYGEVRSRGIPIITRSINFEARHFLEEHERSLLTIPRYLIKLMSEWLVSKKSTLILALNPNDAAAYARLGARKVEVLPLRWLPALIGESHPIREMKPLRVLFLGSSYAISHNRKALQFILGRIMPELARSSPGAYELHISGTRLPDYFRKYIDGKTIIHDGFIPSEEFPTYVRSMDIALVPSPKRVGMQGKVFEPLVRGVPLITSKYSTVGYPFENGKEVFYAETAKEYLSALSTLRNVAVRAAMSRAAVACSQSLFSRERVEEVIREALASV